MSSSVAQGPILRAPQHTIWRGAHMNIRSKSPPSNNRGDNSAESVPEVMDVEEVATLIFPNPGNTSSINQFSDPTFAKILPVQLDQKFSQETGVVVNSQVLNILVPQTKSKLMYTRNTVVEQTVNFMYFVMLQFLLLLLLFPGMRKRKD